MIINYVPGEECRVAIVTDGNLEEFHAERTDAVSRVNNIYVGKVTNVEAGIQAAFVDFGIGDNGFLHVSDLHPRYFQEDDATERVGKKTPRRERPPIQQCLKRGQEVIVQVIKEGVGTKGPTLTSYLSIPGRYLVMMPQMDKVGVSRKVEDEDERKKMRDILSQLELPEGFGFILRTAGFDRNKTDLKRDLAYLQRLWKDMETHRKKSGKRTRLLYSESDLLVRALRDLVTPDISRIIIDEQGALSRAAQFMKIVAPRSSVKLMRYTGRRPIFHAFGIEQQIALSHAREVPLPSGGRLVIDETEAIIAIDVNSGKSRAARDAETNAYKTNVEAVEAICRQLRLRDVGGIIINDLIDMRSAKNRKSIEQLFRDRLKRDRAKSSTAPISTFGILEMTRQRMRGSLRSQHYTECPTCRGKGLVQRPNSVASDALREVAVLLEHDKVARVELVVSGRVAGELLSNRRGSLNRLERQTERQVEVRVSDTLAVDRFTIYAYDANGADIDADKLPKPKSPDQELEVIDTKSAAGDAWAVDPAVAEAPDELEAPPAPDAVEPHPIELEPEGEEGAGGKKKRRRRRRRRKGAGEGEGQGEGQGDGAHGEATEAGAHDTAEAEAGGDEPASGGDNAEQRENEHEGEHGEEQTGGKKKRRRRRRRRKSSTDAEASHGDEAREHGEDRDDHAPEAAPEATDEPANETANEVHGGGEEGEAAPRKKKRRRRRKKAGGGESAHDDRDAGPDDHADDHADASSEPREDGPGDDSESRPEPEAGEGGGKKKRRRRRSKKSSGEDSARVEVKPAETPGDNGATKLVKKKPRTLYGSSRRKLAPSEVPRSHD